MSRAIAVFWILLISAATAAANTPGRPVADPYLNRAMAFINADKLNDFRTELDQQVSQATSDLTKPDDLALIRLASYRHLAWYFGRLNGLSLDDKQLLKWLIAQPRLFPTLMMAISDADPPDQLLGVLSRLKAGAGVSLDDWADLTTAICVDWDKEIDSDNPDQKVDLRRPVRLMCYYISAQRAGVLRANLQELPWELGVYVVDNRVSDPEIVWVLQHYHQIPVPAAAYQDVPDGTGVGYYRDDPQPGQYPYLLPNIRQFGGSAEDRSWYAIAVCRSLGVPAGRMQGMDEEDNTGPVWMGFFHTSNEEWVFHPRADLPGTMTDPQTREELNEWELALLSRIYRTDALQRLTSLALVKLAEPTPAPIVAGDGDNPAPVQLPTPSLDDSQCLAVDLLAAKLSPGNRRAWEALAQLGASGRLSDPQMQSISAAVGQGLLGANPDFALDIYLQLTQGRDVPTQLRVLDQCARLLAARGDLVARVRIAQGDILVKQDDMNNALLAYGEVLRHPVASGVWVIQAVDKVDAILRNAGAMRLLVSAYGSVLDHMPFPMPSRYVVDTPYYQISDRYAQLLDSLGDAGGAQQVRQRMQNLTEASAGIP